MMCGGGVFREFNYVLTVKGLFGDQKKLMFSTCF